MLSQILTASLVLWAAGGAAPTEPPSFAQVVQAEGSFAFSDGSSSYQFFKGGRFVLGPLGMSGRTIEGVWSSQPDGPLVIVGTWGWINGVSRPNDFRRMKINLTPQPGERVVEPFSGLKLHPVYFTVEEPRPRLRGRAPEGHRPPGQEALIDSPRCR
ncbi:MAG: hypothetical protein QM765_35270 [Myxococcales bacterium]